MIRLSKVIFLKNDFKKYFIRKEEIIPIFKRLLTQQMNGIMFSE